MKYQWISPYLSNIYENQGDDGWKPTDWEGEPTAPGVLLAAQWTRGDFGDHDHHNNHFHWLCYFQMTVI